MELLYALQLDTRLALGQQTSKRLHAYRKRLATDQTGDYFDSVLLNTMIRTYSKDQGMVDSVLSHCGETGFGYDKVDASLLLAGIHNFSKENHTSFRWNRNYRRAFDETMREFSSAALKALEMLTSDDIIDTISRKSAHAGYSWLETGGAKKEDYFENIREQFEIEKENALKNKSFNKPIICGARRRCSDPINDDGTYNFGKVKQKTRLVCMIDIWQVICETIWAKPFQKWFGSNIDWYCGGLTRSEIHARVSVSRTNNSHWISLDYKGYDQSISNWLIQDAFSIIKASFRDIGNEELFSIMERDFIHKVFVTPTGMVKSTKGVPSGSMWTNIIDSIVNMLMVRTYMHSKHIQYYKCLIMGDDNLIFLKEIIDKDDIAGYFERCFGIVLNTSKTCSGSKWEEPTFLSAIWTDHGPYRHPKVLIAKMLYPDHYRRYSRKVKEGFTRPEEVFYAYLLNYPKVMREAFDINTFLSDFSHLRDFDVYELEKRGADVPGSMGYYIRYIHPLFRNQISDSQVRKT